MYVLAVLADAAVQPYLGGALANFYAYAPSRFNYCHRPLRDGNKRQLDVLDRQSGPITNIWRASIQFEYGDVALGHGQLVLGRLDDAAES